MMAQFPCLPLWTDAWVADTKHLSLAARGVYHDLLVLMWRTPYCHVPDDNGWLQTHLGITKDELRDYLRPVIEEFCKSEGGFIVQRRLQKEFVRSSNISRKQTDLAKRRWQKQKG